MHNILFLDCKIKYGELLDGKLRNIEDTGGHLKDFCISRGIDPKSIDVKDSCELTPLKTYKYEDGVLHLSNGIIINLHEIILLGIYKGSRKEKDIHFVGYNYKGKCDLRTQRQFMGKIMRRLKNESQQEKVYKNDGLSKGDRKR